MGFQAEGQAGLGGVLSAAVLRSGAGRVVGGGVEAKAAALRTQWKRVPGGWDHGGAARLVGKSSPGAV